MRALLVLFEPDGRSRIVLSDRAENWATWTEWRSFEGGPSPGRSVPTVAIRETETLRAALTLWVRRQTVEFARDAKYIQQAERSILQSAELVGWQTVADITPGGIEAMLAARAEKGNTPSTLNHHRDYLASFLGWCARTERITSNPADQVPRRPVLEKNGSWAMTAAQAVKLIAAVRAECEGPRGHWSRVSVTRWVAYLIACHTGLRRSEIRRLRWGWISKDYTHVSLPKSKTKARKAVTVPLSPECADALKSIRPADATPTTPIIQPFPRDEVVAADLRTHLGAGKWGWHSFRKMLASELALAGVSEAERMDTMRLSDPRLLRETYTDLRHVPAARALTTFLGVWGATDSENSGRKNVDAEADAADTRGADGDSDMPTLPLTTEPTTPGAPLSDRNAVSKHSPSGVSAPGGVLRCATRSTDSDAGKGEKCRRQESNLSPAQASLAASASDSRDTCRPPNVTEWCNGVLALGRMAEHPSREYRAFMADQLIELADVIRAGRKPDAR